MTMFSSNARLKILVLCSSLLISFNAFAKVDIQSWQTASGSKVLFVESTQLPMLDIEMTFDAGSARDGDISGLASMTSSLIGTATTELNEEQISQGFDELGSQFGGSASRDSASISLRTLTRPEILEKSLSLFSKVVSDSQFKQSVFDRELKRLKIGLRERQVKPQSISTDMLWKTLYGNHPYAQPVAGTLESVAKLNTQRLSEFYKTHYNAQNAVIAIVGNVNRKQAAAIANRLTADLPKGQKLPPLPEPKKVAASDIKIDFDSTQTYYSLTQLGVERGNPDYVALFVGNHILGGSGFGSLLMEEVREKRGLVYSVYSYFAPLREKGPFLIGLSTKNASAYEADKVVKETLDSFVHDFSEEKLQAIKDNLIGGFPLRIDSNAKILGYLSLIGFYDLPLDYLEWFPQQVEKITKQDVLNAWKRNLDEDKMVRIMVGKPEQTS